VIGVKTRIEIVKNSYHCNESVVELFQDAYKWAAKVITLNISKAITNMKNHRHILLAVMILLACSTYAQDTSRFVKLNSVQLELGGHGLMYSLNYERILMNADRFKIAGQVGFSYYPPFTGVIDYWIPVGINGLYSIRNHHIEFGAGVIINRISTRDANNIAIDWDWEGFLSARLGYRYQKPNGRFIFRAGFTPVMETNILTKSKYIDSGFITDFHPLPGVSFGYSF
jgi:hypothetical protein